MAGLYKLFPLSLGRAIIIWLNNLHPRFSPHLLHKVSEALFMLEGRG